MDQRLEKLEKAIGALEAAVSRQERRISALEGRETRTPGGREDTVETDEEIELASESFSGGWSLAAVRGTPGLVGRSLLILAGAFLLLLGQPLHRGLLLTRLVPQGTTPYVFGLVLTAIVPAALGAEYGIR